MSKLPDRSSIALGPSSSTRSPSPTDSLLPIMFHPRPTTTTKYPLLAKGPPPSATDRSSASKVKPMSPHLVNTRKGESLNNRSLNEKVIVSLMTLKKSLINEPEVARIPGPGKYSYRPDRNDFKRVSYSFRGKFQDPLERHKNVIIS